MYMCIYIYMYAILIVLLLRLQDTHVCQWCALMYTGRGQWCYIPNPVFFWLEVQIDYLLTKNKLFDSGKAKNIKTCSKTFLLHDRSACTPVESYMGCTCTCTLTNCPNVTVFALDHCFLGAGEHNSKKLLSCPAYCHGASSAMEPSCCFL